jgi:hypothetical protein
MKRTLTPVQRAEAESQLALMVKRSRRGPWFWGAMVLGAWPLNLLFLPHGLYWAVLSGLMSVGFAAVGWITQRKVRRYRLEMESLLDEQTSR